MTRMIELTDTERYILGIEIDKRLGDYKADLRKPANPEHERSLREFITALTSINAKLYPNRSYDHAC